MDEGLTFRYDREGDILYVCRIEPYPEQESEELDDGIVVRLNPVSGTIESWEVLFYSARLLRNHQFSLPTHLQLDRAA
jgi:hypothetical protein